MEQSKGNTPETASAGTGEAGASDRFGRAKEFAGEKYAAAAGSVKDSYAAARDKIGEVDLGAMTGQVRDYVRANPGKALLISVGVGFLIGLLLRRRDDDD